MKYTLALLLTVMMAPAVIAQQTSSTTGNNITPPASVQQQIRLEGGAGIVVSASTTSENLPPSAASFLKSDYPSVTITDIKQNFVKDTFTTNLSDGTTVVFDKQGKVIDITAPVGQTLSMETLADILPQKTSIHLAESGLINMVTAVQNITGRGTMVMTLDTPLPRILYDVDGVFVIAYY